MVEAFWPIVLVTAPSDPRRSPRKEVWRDFPGDPGAKMPHSPSRRPRFDPWIGNYIPHAAIKTRYRQYFGHLM